VEILQLLAEGSIIAIAVAGCTHGTALVVRTGLRMGQSLPRGGLERKVAHHMVLTFDLLMVLRRAAASSCKASLAFFQLKIAAVTAPSGAKNAAPLNPPTRRPATKPAPAPQTTCGPSCAAMPGGSASEPLQFSVSSISAGYRIPMPNPPAAAASPSEGIQDTFPVLS